MAVDCELVELQPLLSSDFNKSIRLQGIDLAINGCVINAASNKTFKEALNILNKWTDNDYKVFKFITDIFNITKTTSKHLKGVTTLSKKVKDPAKLIEIFESISTSEVEDFWLFLENINGNCSYKSQLFEIELMGNIIGFHVPFMKLRIQNLKYYSNNEKMGMYRDRQKQEYFKYFKGVITILKAGGKMDEFNRKLMYTKLKNA
jgi:hypothetical protein